MAGGHIRQIACLMVSEQREIKGKGSVEVIFDKDKVPVICFLKLGSTFYYPSSDDLST